jgi:outer membrane receptor protein involved in Fe transport
MSYTPRSRRPLQALLSLSLGAAAFTLGSPSLYAQNSFGSIVGTVTDTTGADVPGATVVLKNAATNETKTTTSGSGGTYTFLNLNPGNYSVTVTETGFQTLTKNAIDVTIGGTSRVDAALQVGDVAQTVSVNADTQPLLQTDSASLGGVVEGQQVVESPLNGRDVNNLLDFIPGVIPGGGTAGNTVANGGSGSFQAGTQTQAIAYGNYQIGGGFSGQSLFFIDGVESNIPENNVNSLVPTQDAVQEFRVSTNNATAEFGGYSGGVVQISTKQGTNHFHGSAYEYFRNTIFDANDFFDNRLGHPRQTLHQNQFGANLGGPLIKDKLFFFFSFEREKVTSGGLDTFTVPTAAELAGNFQSTPNSIAANEGPGGQLLYNPATGAPYACNGVPNTLCANQIDPTALKLLQLEYPLPNVPGAVVNNFAASAPIEGLQNQYNARLDYTAGPKDRLFARYTFWNPNNGPSDPEGTKVGAGPTGNTTTEAVVGDNHIFNPSTDGDIRLSWLENYNYQVPLSNGFNQSTINANYGTLQGEQVNNHQGLLPGIGLQNYSGGAELSQLYWLNTAYSINASLTKVVGRHTLKFGGNGRQILWTGFGNNQGLGIGASNPFTADSAHPNAGDAVASFLLGIPSSTGISEVATTHSFLHSYGFYAVDTFQASNKLTLNLGGRWEQPDSYSEVNNLDTVLLPNLATTLPNYKNPLTGSSMPTVGGLALVASPQYTSRREESLHWKLFSPRVGFDYRLDDKTVVRGGYGINYLPAEFTADGPGSSPINSAGTSLSNTPGITYAGEPTVANPLPNGINQPLGRNPAAFTQLLGEGIGSRVPNQPYGYVQQYNFGFERELDRKSTLSVAYAASKGTHLVLSQGYTGTGLNLDQLPDQYDTIGGDPTLGTGLFKQVANPYAGQFSSGGVLDQPTVFEGYLLKPYPQYTGVTQAVPRFGASMYNALQVAYKRTFSHAGQVQVAYTYARLMSNTDNTSSFEDGQGGEGVVQDNTNILPEWSLSLQDLTHNLVINYGVDLPFGHGETFLKGSNGVVNALVGGWRLAGITTIHSGLPVPFQAGGLNYLSQYFGAGPIRPNVVGGCHKNVSGSRDSKAAEWFNTSCFVQPGPFSFGNESRVDGQVRAAGAANFDASLGKNFKVYEQFTGKFSVEAFNLFNRAQFGAPNANTAAGAAFGTVTAQANLPRVLQFALRFNY